MTATELFGEGINLMISGMGFVLFFLFVLIYAISLLSTLINKFFPEPIIDPPPTKSKTTITQTDEISRLRPVIAAAIAHHRKKMQG